MTLTAREKVCLEIGAMSQTDKHYGGFHNYMSALVEACLQHGIDYNDFMLIIEEIKEYGTSLALYTPAPKTELQDKLKRLGNALQ